MICPTPENIMSALAEGMTIRRKDGTCLLVSTDALAPASFPDAQLPYLSLSTGSMNTLEFSQWETLIEWDINGVLMVQGQNGKAGEEIRSLLYDLFFATAYVRGLYVDLDGHIVPYGEKHLRLLKAGELSCLANRGGPVLRTVRVRPEAESDPYAIADIVIHVESVIQHLPDEQFGRVSIVSLGVMTLDDQHVVKQPLDPSEIQTQSAYVTPALDIELSAPVGPLQITYLTGSDPSKQLKYLRIQPPFKTVVTTLQLETIVYFFDNSSEDVTNGASYSTSNAAVATVSPTGLVTAVAAGTATITSTYHGLSAETLITV